MSGLRGCDHCGAPAVVTRDLATFGDDIPAGTRADTRLCGSCDAALDGSFKDSTGEDRTMTDTSGDMVAASAAAWGALSPAERQAERDRAMREATAGVRGWSDDRRPAGTAESDAPVTPARPGDRCRFVRDGRRVVAVEHVAPCRDGHKTGTVTDVQTGRIIPPRE